MLLTMTNRLTEYRRFVRDVHFLLKCSGLWPLSKKSRLGYKLLYILAVFCSFMGSVIILNFCYHAPNIFVLTKGISLGVSLVTIFLKVISFFVYRHYLRQLNRPLSESFEESLKNPTLQPVLLALLPYCRGLTYMITILTAITVITLVISSLTVIIKFHEFHLPFPSRYPWTFQPGGMLYICHFIFETLIIAFCIGVTSSVDSIFCIYIFQICGELKVIGYQFKQLKSGFGYNHDIRDCIRRHCTIMKYRDKLQRIFGPIIIWLYVSGAFVMCGLIYQIFQIKQFTTVKIIRLVCYVVMKMGQTFLYAWCGNLIMIHSNACLKEPYTCDWPASRNIKMMRDILIIITQKPLELKVFGAFVISIDMFTKIVNSAVSYFFLLQTLDER